MTTMSLPLRRRILKIIEPTPELTRSARAVARDLAARIRQVAAARGLRVEPRLVGSLAKDTHLSDPLDIDVFVLFPRATPRAALEKNGVALGRAVLRTPQLKYAEHPYVHGRSRGFQVDIVPAYKLRDGTGPLTAVDRTPFHTAYVRAHASKRHRREIRLLKRFLRGTQTYGAETATGGVSGYLAELLVLKYGSLARTIAAMAAWKAPVELALGREATALGGPLVFVDPVDPSRNAAAAVTEATLSRLGRAARAFQQTPSFGFFFPNAPKPLAVAELRRRLRKHPTLALEVPRPPGRTDTALPQGRRLLTKIGRALEDEGFTVAHSDLFSLGGDRLLLLWEHDPQELPPTYLHRGPRASDAEHAERFRAKWQGHRSATEAPHVENGRWVVRVRRARRTALACMADHAHRLLDGFDYPKAAVDRMRFNLGRDLARRTETCVPLTVFLRRLDPWDA